MTIDQINKIDAALRTGLAYCESAERELKPNQGEQARRDIQVIREGIKSLDAAAK